MKTITADFNRRGPHGTLKISLRRFSETPKVGEQFVVVDGEDRYTGTVRRVNSDSRTVLIDMAWEQESPQHSHLSASGA